MTGMRSLGLRGSPDMGLPGRLGGCDDVGCMISKRRPKGTRYCLLSNIRCTMVLAIGAFCARRRKARCMWQFQCMYISSYADEYYLSISTMAPTRRRFVWPVNPLMYTNLALNSTNVSVVHEYTNVPYVSGQAGYQYGGRHEAWHSQHSNMHEQDYLF